ncbi:MAG TPA: secretin N-terminal domain-containing protein [Phycisphaerales bacterium]
MLTHGVGVGIVTLSLMGSVALAARSAADPPAQQQIYTLPEQIDLNALVLLTADALDLTIEFDPNLLRASAGGPAALNFRGTRELSREELWEFCTQVLAARGLALVRPPGSKVLSLVRADAAVALAGVRTDGEPGERSGFVSELVRLSNRSGKDIVEVVGKLGLKAPSAVTPIGDSGLLLVSEYATRIDDLKQLIQRFDTPREQVRIATVPARNLPAASLAAAVTTLATKRDTIEGGKLKGEVSVAPDGRSLMVIAPEDAHPRWNELITLLDQIEPVSTVEYATKAFTPKEVAELVEKTVRVPAAGPPGGTPDATPDRLRVVVNELTGTLIVTATPSQHERVRSLIERLDSTLSPAAGRPLRVFPLRNRPAEEVMATLTSLVQGGALQSSEVEGSMEDPATGPQRTSGTEARAQRSPSSGSIVPVVVPPGTGTTAGVAPRPGRENLLPQGVRVASASGIALPDLSINMDKGTNSIIAMAEPRMLTQIQKLIELIDVRQPQVMLEMTLVSLSEQDAMNLGIELEKVGLFDGASYQLSSLFGLSGGTAGNRVAGDSRGLTSAVLNPGDFSVVLRALQTISRGSTRSVPSILVSNNESASFDSTLQQPYIVSNTTSGAGTTTSFGGTQDAGTTIQVTPQIGQADQLLLKYSITLSSFVGAPPANGLPPARQQNSVGSKATIPDGFTVVVGGIELQSEGRNISQVPGVGDVPILGELFRTRDNSTGRSRFYVFIRATVLRDQQLNDLKFLSGRVSRTTGVSDGFPEMRARIVR